MNAQIKRISAFQTSDGVIHDNPIEALQHQCELDMVQLFSGQQRAAFTEKTAAMVVAKNLDAFQAVIKTYKEKIRRATPRKS
jgi:hypothetical protein